ncbi:MAG: amino acid ABC transporter permease [Candidatus Bipolaricaulota bacterium]
MNAWNSIAVSAPALIAGAGATLAVVIAAVGGGLILGIPVGVAHGHGHRLLRILLSIFDRIFRGFPVIVLLFLFYFGLGGLPGVHMPPFAAAVLVLGLRSAAYQGQIFRGALGMVEPGQEEAARALGLSRGQALLWILLPQALRFSMPGLANEYAVVLKDSALAFVVGVVELMSVGRFMATRTGDPLTAYLAVAALYWILTSGGVAALRVVERHMRIPGLGVRRVTR